ncbi:MAG: CSLREA domain-containing protein, partial [SAR202 cluster bacterium]|nr:CSLREA domain-containing protein [SAR202 cluster bacterium]
MRNTRGLKWISLAVSLFVLAVVSTPWEGVAEGATLTVTTNVDSNDGTCDTNCSLREAIAAAASGDTVSIPADTYTL